MRYKYTTYCVYILINTQYIVYNTIKSIRVQAIIKKGVSKSLSLNTRYRMIKQRRMK